MAVHAHAIRARAVSCQREQAPNAVARETTDFSSDLVLGDKDRARQIHLNQFLREVASREHVSFMQEREQKREQRH